MKKILYFFLMGIGAFFTDLIQDKDGRICVREIATLCSLCMIVFAFFAETYYGLHVPEYMFFAFIGMVGIGKVGYSIEKKAPQDYYPTYLDSYPPTLQRRTHPMQDEEPLCDLCGEASADCKCEEEVLSEEDN